MSLMNRASLRKLSAMRITDAQTLLRYGQYCGAYYLAGYAVECALKARIAQNTRRFDFPDKKIANEGYTHDLGVLLRLAEINTGNTVLASYWRTAKDWSEEDRYARFHQSSSQKAAIDLLKAITDPKDGILQWIEKN